MKKEMSNMDRFVTYAEFTELKTEVSLIRFELGELKMEVAQLRADFLEFKEYASRMFDAIFNRLDTLNQEYVLMNHAIRQLEAHAKEQDKRWAAQEKFNQETREAFRRVEVSLAELRAHAKEQDNRWATAEKRWIADDKRWAAQEKFNQETREAFHRVETSLVEIKEYLIKK